MTEFIVIAVMFYLYIGWQFALIYKRMPNEITRVNFNENLFLLFIVFWWLPFVVFVNIKKLL